MGPTVARPKLKQPLNSSMAKVTDAALVKATSNATSRRVAMSLAAVPKVRQIQKEGEINISAYFPAEEKASLRIDKDRRHPQRTLARSTARPSPEANVLAFTGLGEG